MDPVHDREFRAPKMGVFTVDALGDDAWKVMYGPAILGKIVKVGARYDVFPIGRRSLCQSHTDFDSAIELLANAVFNLWESVIRRAQANDDLTALVTRNETDC